MKFKNHLIVVAMLGGFFLTANATFAQGSLTPPGGPAPTMKTADQIEPRTIVNAANTPGDTTNSFIISKSGSYYLTTNILGTTGKSGIEITTNDVTLDLNGFTLQGVAGSVNGVNFIGDTSFLGFTTSYARTNITVRNGIIRNWGGDGIHSSSYSGQNFLLEQLKVCFNSTGALINGSGVARDCFFANNSDVGLNFNNALISNCTVNNNGSYAVFANNSTISGCFVQNNGSGISANGGIVSGCLVQNNTNTGIYAGSGTDVINNTCRGNNSLNGAGAGGILISGDAVRSTRVEDNLVTANGSHGILVDNTFGSKVIVIKNSVSGNGASNYVVPSGNVLGPIANDSTGAITNTSPWGNFSF